MITIIKFIAVFFTVFAISACGIYNIDAPPPGDTDVWEKPGHAKSHIYSALMKCRQQLTTGTLREKVDAEQMCMLRHGFKRVERPTHRSCLRRYQESWNSPACRSLRGELIITPDESSSLPPPVVNERPAANTNTPTTPIAPSLPTEQRLQDRVQQDSNRQINNLLRSSGSR